MSIAAVDERSVHGIAQERGVQVPSEALTILLNAARVCCALGRHLAASLICVVAALPCEERSAEVRRGDGSHKAALLLTGVLRDALLVQHCCRIGTVELHHEALQRRESGVSR